MSPAQTLDRSRWFVSTEWLAARLGTPGIAIIDASWYLPTMQRDPVADYAAAHIPGAVRFDIDAIADKTSGLPHMLPTPDAFAAAMQALGIGDGTTIIVYDGAGLFAAPRVWWTLKVFGAREVFILDGGMPQWLAESRPVTDDVPLRQPTHFTARLDHSMVRDVADVKAALQAGSATVVDARPADRFAGHAPEPRPGVRSGHMPGAVNVPFPKVVENGKLLDAERLAKVYAEAGVETDKPIITSCGSGVSAAILWLGLETIGARQLGLYDGSWAEWGSRDDTPIVVD